jgi:iron complex transport system substrate-binding protein
MIKPISLLFILMLLSGCGKPVAPAARKTTPQRIISLSPNITETLYELNLNDRLVGISRFSTSSTNSGIAIVGDFLNINYESIVGLRPDLVILEQSAETPKARLESLGIPYLETGSLTLADVTASVQAIGAACGATEEAAQLNEALQERIDAARNMPARRPRVLITFGAFSNPSEVEQVYAFGAGCIHSELLEIAGGDNLVAGGRPSVQLSREALIRLNPEMIIELTTGGPGNSWSNLSTIDAVQNNRIYVLDGLYTCIPSPGNLMQTLEDFSRMIRQENVTHD